MKAGAWGSALAIGLASAGAAQQISAGQGAGAVAHPARWPAVAARPALDANVEARIDRLLAAMSLEDKVGQLIQPDIGTVTPADLKTYKLGAVLNGGNSGPYGDDTAAPAKWLQLADEFYDASMARSDGRPRIPVIWGTDAVHGNNNVPGATLFPHNIGLGAAHDPALIERIGRVTAEETATAGQDWSFAPTLAVVQDDRWGRTYESYSEDPELVASYAGRVVTGLQGRVGGDFLGHGHVVATAKHWVGDGGTGGRDKGDTQVDENMLRDVHAAGYPPALQAGALTAMTSFSSWNGAKMSGNVSLITGVLKERWGFSGFVVSDWNSYAQVPGCSVESCAAAVNAGLDMFMVSGDWKRLYANTLAQARSGEIPAARLDDAVRRILRVKIWAGLFEAGRPSSRPLAGRFDLLGSAANKAVARQAVRESLVLLKNNGGVLPLKPGGNILVAGQAADSVAQQAGGWSISWQGTGVTNANFPNATTIWRGIAQQVQSAGGTATYAPDGRFTAKPDAAIVVFGETPYAEFMGDRATLEFAPGDKRDLALLKRLKAAGVPVVAVFLSGRPLWVNAELNAADAFVAAFLPGSEGGGVADMLFRTTGEDFRGRLSFSWPRRPDQYVLNKRDPGYDPLFPLGYGLTYASRATVPPLDETRPAGLAAGVFGEIFKWGRVPNGWTVALVEGADARPVTANTERSASGALAIAGVDYDAQEDGRRLTWTGARAAALRISADRPVDVRPVPTPALTFAYRVDAAPGAAVTLGVGAARVPITGVLRGAPVGGWRTLAVPLRCFAGADLGHVTEPFTVSTAGRLTLSVADIRIAQGKATACPA